MIRSVSWWTASAAVALASLGCSDDLVLPPFFGEGGAPSGPGSGGSGNEGGGFTVSIGSGGSGGGACGIGCSGDLKTVIDTCTGEEIMTCEGDLACLDGGCSRDTCAAAESSKTSVGCDYWALEPDHTSDIVGGCFAAYVANTWTVPVHLEVAHEGAPFSDTDFIRIPSGQGQSISYEPYDADAGLPPGEVAIVFLSHVTPQPAKVPPCPVDAAINEDAAVFGSGLGQAFHITTDRPVVAYTILPFGGGQSAATSATLLLPSSAWGDNYIAVDAYAKSAIVGEAVPSFAVLASQDDTEVTLLPKAAVQGGGGLPGGLANQPIKYLLDRGEYFQLAQSSEQTGSVIGADKPVGVWGAASCLNVPVDTGACDSAHQQIPPVRALGRRYAGVRYRNRVAATEEEAPPWRLVGAVDGTELAWEPEQPAGAPTTLDKGEVAEFDGTGPFVVTSQDNGHPFYFAQYMTGGGPLGGEGDPEWVNVVPIDQFLDSYVFFTDPTYSETSLVVVRAKSTRTMMFEDVTLACAGTLGGWEELGDFEYTRVDLVTGDFESVNGCENGVQTMQSEAPFGVTVWGWGGYSDFFTRFVSYAYPAGASLQNINEVVVPPDVPD